MAKYEELKEMLCEELDKITKKGELSAGSLDAVDKLTHSIKSLATIIAMEKDGGYSGRYSQEYSGEYSGDGSYRQGESMARGRSRARRDSMGRYSRDAAVDEIANAIREGMDDMPEEAKREAKRFLSKLEQM